MLVDAPSPNSGRAGLLWPLAVPEQTQVDGIRQCVVTGVVGVPVVSAVVESKDPGRGIRVTEHTIKVDHIVIFSADGSRFVIPSITPGDSSALVVLQDWESLVAK